ncbi:glucose-1-phosphate cytidylyltransferase [Candidatus Enterovibrio escicola]|uniref:Glucose-1-phosphate cytidylyltransferase n=1 Tax=Candidatus Enterovibrio escicola TaxID=1927127 RepID=A0A2A5T741_9GAMM|nr:glucose-1-phosphate cytidylyltransferase [Candidatus Enterovibrio escacola]PCS23993.1 Glucose-1-phosphate cytidylyltransferase [Candidatus Enterovibrio escacola]
MKAVILAGGFGTRISEETHLKPKPMIGIGGKPILWHIMKTYSHYGINDFVICLGYKGYLIKEYFFNYSKHSSDITVDLSDDSLQVHNNYAESWKVTLVDTGEDVMTGGRLRRVSPYIKDESAFCLTYGDGVSDVNIGELIKFHQQHGKLATLTAITPLERFGVLDLAEDHRIQAFREKPKENKVYINGGFFVLSPQVLNYIDGDDISFEKQPLEKLTAENNLYSFKHNGFWQCMDTLRDKNYLEELWDTRQAPWKVWS